MPRTATLDRPPDATRLADLAQALERTLSWVRRAALPAEWSAVALSTMDVLLRLGPQRVTDLTARERITQPGMTGLVARMEAAGFVSRQSDPNDGRATLVTITTAGRDYLRALHQRRAEALTAQIELLPPQQRDALVAATDALIALAAEPART
jgi:DNA-binding MarR family transcriptional regulator